MIHFSAQSYMVSAPRFQGSSQALVPISGQRMTTETPKVNIHDDFLDPINRGVLQQFFNHSTNVWYDYGDGFRYNIYDLRSRLTRNNQTGEYTESNVREKGESANKVVRKAFDALVQSSMETLPKEFVDAEEIDITCQCVRYRMKPGEEAPSLDFHNDGKAYNIVYTLHQPALERGFFQAVFDGARDLLKMTEVDVKANRLVVHEDSGKLLHGVSPVFPKAGQKTDEKGYVYRDIIVIWVQPVKPVIKQL